MPAKKTFSTQMVRMLYRVAAPSHPRGWIDIDWEEQNNGRLRVVSHGVARFKLPTLEMADCPADARVRGYCREMLVNAVGALRDSLAAGHKVAGGDIVDLRRREEESPVRVRLVAQGENRFCLEDVARMRDRFPASAVAKYIVNASEALDNPSDRFEAAALAAELHAEDFEYFSARPSEEFWHDSIDQSNARAYFVMGDALMARRRTDEAQSAFREGIARAPYVAEKMKKDGDIKGVDAAFAEIIETTDPWALQAEYRERHRA